MRDSFQLMVEGSEVPASKEQVSAYLADLEQNPGFPGARVAAKLKNV